MLPSFLPGIGFRLRHRGDIKDVYACSIAIPSLASDGSASDDFRQQGDSSDGVKDQNKQNWRWHAIVADSEAPPNCRSMSRNRINDDSGDIRTRYAQAEKIYTPEAVVPTARLFEEPIDARTKSRESMVSCAIGRNRTTIQFWAVDGPVGVIRIRSRGFAG